MIKWLQAKPRLLLLHEPTQGVDVGARQALFAALHDAARTGTAILCASTDYEELAQICDRVLIFARGRIVRELGGAELSKRASLSIACAASRSAGSSPRQQRGDEHDRPRQCQVFDRFRASGASAPVRLVRFAEAYALLGGIVVLGAIFGLLRPTIFLSWANITTILGSQAVLVVLTLALIIPLTAGDYDLSVASVLTVSGMIIAVLNAQHAWPLGGAMVVAVAAGLVTGLVNAGFILYFRIPSLIVTLGTGTFISGVVLWMRRIDDGERCLLGIDRMGGDPAPVRHPAGLLLRARALRFALVFLRVHHRRAAASLRRPRPRGGPSFRRPCGSRAAAELGRLGRVKCLRRHYLRRHDRRRRPAIGPYLPVARIRRCLFGSDQHLARALQSVGIVRRGLFLVTGITGLTILGIETYVQNLFYGGGLVLSVALSQLVRNREAQDFG